MSIISNMTARSPLLGEILGATTFSVALILLFFSDVALLTNTPMQGISWELQDPIISHWVMTPSLKVFQYELFTNFNLLWSNLRGLGMPILVNDVQLGPMFPLTILLSWVPDHLFWNVFALVRLFLFCIGAFLLARRIFGFELTGSFVFVLTLVFALFNIRSQNHASLSALTAGLWYLYFLFLIVRSSPITTSRNSQIGAVLGLVFSLYSLFTAGFPETAVVIAVVALLTCPYIFLTVWLQHKCIFFSTFAWLALAHIVAIGMAMPQLLALLEINQLSSDAFRGSHSMGRWNVHPIDYFLGKLTRLETMHPPDPNIHVFGLIPTFLFSLGLVKFLRRSASPFFYCFAIGMITCGVFFLLKNFELFRGLPLVRHVDHLLVSLPIVKQTWFNLYSFPILLISFSFFAGIGADALAESKNKVGALRESMLILSIALMIVVLLNTSSIQVTNQNYLDVLRNFSKSTWILGYFSLFVFWALLISNTQLRITNRLLLGIPILVLASTEIFLSTPRTFVPISTYRSMDDLTHSTNTILMLLDKANINREEVRFRDKSRNHFGYLIPSGLSTFRNGAGALYTERQQRYRQDILGAEWSGFFPITSEPKNQGWVRSSAQLFLVNEQSLLTAELQREDSISGPLSLPKDDYRTLSGRYTRLGTIGVDLQLFRTGHKKAFTNRILEVAQTLGGSEKLIRRYNKDLDAAIESSMSDDNAFEHSMNFLAGVGVDSLHATLPRAIYLDSATLPRAYLPNSCITSVSITDSLTRIKQKEFQIGNAVIENPSSSGQLACNEFEGVFKKVDIETDRGSNLVFSSIKGPTILIVNDHYYPGWYAIDTLTGDELEILPANVAFRAIILPDTREYMVQLRYRPSWLQFSLYSFFSSWLIIVFLLYLLRRSQTQNAANLTS